MLKFSLNRKSCSNLIFIFSDNPLNDFVELPENL